MIQGVNLSRKEVLEHYNYRKDLINLKLSLHAQRRIEERVDGEFPIVPTMCRITKENICSGRSGDGKRLSSVKIRLDYKKDKWMFLVICPNSGVVKTLYINSKNATKEKALKKKYGIKEECCIEESYYDLKEKTPEEKAEKCGADAGGEERGLKDEGILPGYMDGKRNWWKTLFRIIYNITRQ